LLLRILSLAQKPLVKAWGRGRVEVVKSSALPGAQTVRAAHGFSVPEGGFH
jgi:hypothetical protein